MPTLNLDEAHIRTLWEIRMTLKRRSELIYWCVVDILDHQYGMGITYGYRADPQRFPGYRDWIINRSSGGIKGDFPRLKNRRGKINADLPMIADPEPKTCAHSLYLKFTLLSQALLYQKTAEATGAVSALS